MALPALGTKPIECGMRKCDWTGLETDRVDRPHPFTPGLTTSVCPKCGCDSYRFVKEKKPSLTALAKSIADEAARSDIECHCLWTSENAAERWFDTTTIEDQARETDLRELVDRSITYLEMRGLLVRHVENKALVRIVLPA